MYWVPIRKRIRNRWQAWRVERAIRPGEIYEDCMYHPMVCVKNDGGDLTGVSMVDGRLGCCSMFGCGPMKMTLIEARARVLDWDAFQQAEV